MTHASPVNGDARTGFITVLLRLAARWWFPLALTVFLITAFLESAAGNGFLGLGVSASPQDAIDVLCPGPDPCWYLTSGQDLLDQGFVRDENFWIWNLWPPGVSVLSAVYIVMARSGMSLTVAAGCITIASWVIVLTAWKSLLDRYAGRILSLVAVSTVALGQIMRGWYLGNGLLYMESASTVCLLLALLFVAKATRFGGAERSVRARFLLGAAAGAALAAAAYLRTPFEPPGLVLTIVTIIAILLVLAWGSFAGRTSEWWGSKLSPLVPLIGLVTAFHVLTVPWRIIVSQRVRAGDRRWSVVSDLVWKGTWTPTDELVQNGASFLASGTFNTACRVEPVLCRSIYDSEISTTSPAGRSVGEFQRLTVQAFLDHPLQWLWIKVEASPRFWFAAPRSVDKFELLENGVLLVLLLMVVLLGYRRLGPTLYLVFISVLIMTLASIFVSHYEARYLYPIKSVLPVLAALCVTRLGAATPPKSAEQKVTREAAPGCQESADDSSPIAPQTDADEPAETEPSRV